SRPATAPRRWPRSSPTPRPRDGTWSSTCAAWSVPTPPARSAGPVVASDAPNGQELDSSLAGRMMGRERQAEGVAMSLRYLEGWQPPRVTRVAAPALGRRSYRPMFDYRPAWE